MDLFYTRRGEISDGVYLEAMQLLVLLREESAGAGTDLDLSIEDVYYPNIPDALILQPLAVLAQWLGGMSSELFRDRRPFITCLELDLDR